MSDHTDRTPTEEQQDGRQDADSPDVTRQDATVGVVEAAHLLGTTTDAVRARLRRGTLQGHKVEGEWQVVMPAPTVGQQDTTEHQQDATADRQDTQQSGDRTPTVDLAPLTTLIDDLTRRNADLSAAAAMWQTRAAHLENELKQLTAGETPAESLHNPGTIDPEGPQMLQESDPAPTGVLAWWKRLWGA
jgi:hypothetical protein